MYIFIDESGWFVRDESKLTLSAVGALVIPRNETCLGWK